MKCYHTPFPHHECLDHSRGGARQKGGGATDETIKAFRPNSGVYFVQRDPVRRKNK